MALNIFKAARSISRIAIAIWVIIFFSFLLFSLVGRTSIWGFDPIFLTMLFTSMLLGALFILAFTWATGRIVRGFMGIPRGQDHKNKPDNSTAIPVMNSSVIAE